MSEKFTPGPWKVIDNRPKVDYPVKKGMEWVKNTIEIVGFKRYTGELTCVARIDHRIGYYPIDDEDIANADLLADAWQLPDLRKENTELKAINKEMYEALETVCGACIYVKLAGKKCCEYCVIRKALCKARGEEGERYNGEG